MSFPTLEEYNEAVQHPSTAFYDPELKRGTVATTGLGLPLALCGGFALTYNVQSGGKKFAVRCFHKKSDLIEKRYAAISSKIQSLHSPYFVDFEFQKLGVNVNGKNAPVVKMAWAKGETLGEFIEGNFRNQDKLQILRCSLAPLIKFLETNGVAHGDIQPGNVMISNLGRNVQLIDYDGMYVDDIKSLGGAELGHRNFQHPKRSTQAWNAHLDRFSFIELHLALRALEVRPELWDQTKSDGDSILFKANDFAAPHNSSLFDTLKNIEPIADDTKNFIAICQNSFDIIPSFEDFLARKNIPQSVITITGQTKPTIHKYIGAFDVLDASNYELCLAHVGDRVEIIGKIFEIKESITRHGKPYAFINFGSWRGKIVKISIWSEGLAVLPEKPTSGWIGKWISVTGLMEPPYKSKKHKYSHLSISITQKNQLHFLQESEAFYRLDSFKEIVNQGTTSVNQGILAGIKGNKRSDTIKYQQVPVTSKNQSVLAAMKRQQAPAGQTSTASHKQSQRPFEPQHTEKKENFSWVWYIIILAFLLFLIKYNR